MTFISAIFYSSS